MDSQGERDEDAFEAESLAELLRAWRERVDPRAIGELELVGRRGSGLSQGDTARLAGVTERWYRALEGGKPANYSADFLDRLADALRLSGAERHVLYMKAIGRTPTLLAGPDTDGATKMDGLLQQFLDSQSPNPACVLDLAWNVIGWNRPLLDWFPWAVSRANFMRWTTLNRDARGQLVNWREDWVRPHIGQMRYARVRFPEYEALRRLECEILAGSPEARRMWDRREFQVHADGDLRRLRPACYRGREVSVRIMELRPMRSTRLRVIVLMEVSPGGRQSAAP